MKASEIEKKAKTIRRTIGKKYGFRQRDYINWKIKDGYFFELDTTYVVNTELLVKPLFMDDLYWKIIYPHKETKHPDSLRGTGILCHLSEKIWEERFPEDLEKGFSVERFEPIMEDVYRKAEMEIEAFLHQYPSPDLFGKFLSDNKVECDLSNVLILINEGKFEEAAQFAKGRIGNRRGCINSWRMPDGTEKEEFEFILEYCLKKIEEG